MEKRKMSKSESENHDFDFLFINFKQLPQSLLIPECVFHHVDV